MVMVTWRQMIQCSQTEPPKEEKPPNKEPTKTSSPWTTIHRTALFRIHSDWVQTHAHTVIYLSSCINRWIYTDIHKYTFLICIFILISCYVSVKDSSYWMRAHRDLKTHTTQLNSWKNPYWSACTLNPTNLSVLDIIQRHSRGLQTINIQQLHLNKHTEEYGTVKSCRLQSFLAQQQKWNQIKIIFSRFKWKIYLYIFIYVFIVLCTHSQEHNYEKEK